VLIEKSSASSDRYVANIDGGLTPVRMKSGTSGGGIGPMKSSRRTSAALGHEPIRRARSSRRIAAGVLSPCSLSPAASITNR
jgi:hypothetical protein